MNKRILLTAALFAIIAIILGAFGAHGLKAHLSDAQLISYETGVRYQMYHVFLLLFLGSYTEISTKSQRIIYRLTVLGVVFFSGSIYLLSTSPLTGMPFSFLGPITPIGGLLLISAWTVLFRSFLKITGSSE